MPRGARAWPDGHKGSLEGVEVRSLTSTKTPPVVSVSTVGR